tara:strand:- start:357 stop:620 length:264 start_codon:yes stop_codon:yes gene_type:complete
MNKRIEVGCLVMLIDSEVPNDPDIGKTGAVIGHDARRSDCWRVDFGGVTLDTQGRYSDVPCWCATKILLRIDDYTEETETQEEEMMV